MSRKFHIAIATDDLEASINDYSERLKAWPEVVVEGSYALWRTEMLNLSISCKSGEKPGTVRHIGFEDIAAEGFEKSTDVNGLVWEHFSEADQKKEIKNKYGDWKK